jgi:hypothetical protein
MVRLQTLDLRIGVRVPASQPPLYAKAYATWLVFLDRLTRLAVLRSDRNGEEIIRIISARAAEKHEIRRYQEQAVD